MNLRMLMFQLLKMKIIFFLLAFFVGLSFADPTARCPANTISSPHNTKICYLFSSDSKSFANAETFCNTQGGNLATVFDQFTNSYLLSKAFDNLGAFRYYWIGGTKKMVQMPSAPPLSVWGWTKNNQLMTFTDWDPTANPGGDAVAVQTNGLWLDINGNVSNPFICEIPAQVSYCDDGWAYYNKSNFCYKKFAAPDTINQTFAEGACIKQNAHLASIHSMDENNFLRDLAPIGYSRDDTASSLWFGAFKNDTSDNWYWYDKTPFDFSNWGHSYPYYDYACSTFWPDYTSHYENKPGEWNANECSQYSYAYLCKKVPYVMSV